MKLISHICLLVLLTSLLFAQAISAQEIDFSEFILDGGKLTAEQAADLEKRVADDAEDITSRGLLLGYYMLHQFDNKAAGKAKARHALWVIENMSGSGIAGSPLVSLDPILDGDAFYEARQLWMQKIEENPYNISVLANAAQFMLLYDREQSEKLLKKLQELEPGNPEWRKRLGELYMLDSLFLASMAKDEEKSADALSEMEESVRIAGDEQNRFYMLGDMAMLAFNSGDCDKAADYANELLIMATRYKDDWNYGNAVHDANTTLGRIAIKDGEIDTAKAHLIASGKTPGSPQLDSFGPSMDLAKELIAKGETEAVIMYLELCKNFWEMDRGSLDNWIMEIKDTGTTGFRQ